MRAVVFIRAAPREEHKIDPKEATNIIKKDSTIDDEKLANVLDIITIGKMKNLPSLSIIEKNSNVKFIFFEPAVRCTFMTEKSKERLLKYLDYDNTSVFQKMEQLTEEIEKEDYTEIEFLDYYGCDTVVNFLWQFRLKYDDRYHFYLNLTDPVNVDDMPDEIVYYNLFSMEQLPEDLSENEDPLDNIKTLAMMLIKYLDLGFHEKEIRDDRDRLGWEFNLAVPEMDIFIRQFDLYPPVEDHRITYREHFLTDAQYRQVVTIQLAKVLSNFMRTNKMIKKKSSSYFLTSEPYQKLVE